MTMVALKGLNDGYVRSGLLHYSTVGDPQRMLTAAWALAISSRSTEDKEERYTYK